MYNKYLSNEADAFSELYRPVECEECKDPMSDVERDIPKIKEGARSSRFDLKKLLYRLDLDKMGIVPIVLLLLLLHDVDDEEKLIIIALVVLFGI